VTRAAVAAYGAQSMTRPLRRVLVRAPSTAACRAWRRFGWRAEPDPAAAAREHEALCDLLAGAGAEVIRARSHDAGLLDAIYVYDPALVTARGALLLRPGKAERRDEVALMERELAASGVPVAARLEAPAAAEGGDTLWLDDHTLLVGRSYRTNDHGIAALRAALPDVDVVAFDLPHLRGPREVLHLLSLLSPVDDDLAVASLPLLPARLVELLRSRGVSFVEVPDDEFATMACNVLALGPRVALTREGNPETRRRMEAAGIDVLTYRGEEISVKGDGGPTCLTRPLLRA
jgi:dimethylargininase